MEHKGQEVMANFQGQRNQVENYIEQLKQENKMMHIQLLQNYIMQQILKRQLNGSIEPIFMEYGYVQIDDDRIILEYSDIEHVNKFLKNTGWKMKIKDLKFLVEKNN